MICKKCNEPLDQTEYEAKIADHSTEVIKTLLSLFVAGFGFYFTLAAIYFAYRSSANIDPEDVEVLRGFMIALSCLFGFITWLFRYTVEKTFLIYQRNMLIVAGKQRDRVFEGVITSLIRFGKIGAAIIYALLLAAIATISFV